MLQSREGGGGRFNYLEDSRELTSLMSSFKVFTALLAANQMVRSLTLHHDRVDRSGAEVGFRLESTRNMPGVSYETARIRNLWVTIIHCQ